MPNKIDIEDLLAIDLTDEGIRFIRQYAYALPRQFKADFAFLQASLLVEIQGGIYSRQAHGSITGIKKDLERLNIATMAGWRVLRFTPDEVKSGAARVTIKAALQKFSVGPGVSQPTLKGGD